jgi:MFS family permease
VDRFGPGRVLFCCAALAGLGFVLLSQVDSYLLYVLVFIGVIGLGMQSGFDAATMGTVGKWFVRNRGVAMSLTATGFASGGAVLTPLVALGVAELGWRDTTLIIGILIWVIVPPLSTRLYRSPEARGLQPDGAPQPPSVTATGSQAMDGFSVREAVMTRAYWQLALSLGLRSIVFGIIMVQMVAIMEWKGVSETTAGFLVGLMAFLGIPTALFMGWLGDRVPKNRLVAVGDCTASISLLILLLLDQVPIWTFVVVFVLWSPNQGNWPLSWALLGERFGRKNFGALRGGLIATMSVLSFAAPLYTGWVYDRTESYTWALTPAFGLMLASAAMIWWLPKVPKMSQSTTSM